MLMCDVFFVVVVGRLYRQIYLYLVGGWRFAASGLSEVAVGVGGVIGCLTVFVRAQRRRTSLRWDVILPYVVGLVGNYVCCGGRVWRW